MRLRAPVTTPARTWMDMCRRGSLADALVAGDAGLRRGVFTRDDLAAAVAGAEHPPGLAPPVAVPSTSRTGYARHPWSPRRSPTSSTTASAARMPGGDPPPGRFLARVDFLWDDPERGVRVIGESDGVLKYAERGEAWREKVREDELRADGYGFVRWGMADLRSERLARPASRRPPAALILQLPSHLTPECDVRCRIRRGRRDDARTRSGRARRPRSRRRRRRPPPAAWSPARASRPAWRSRGSASRARRRSCAARCRG